VVAVRTVLNVIWLLLCGIWLALGYLLAGVICCVLIVTIPFGLVSRKAPWFTSIRRFSAGHEHDEAKQHVKIAASLDTRRHTCRSGPWRPNHRAAPTVCIRTANPFQLHHCQPHQVVEFLTELDVRVAGQGGGNG
jgi:uncharacterized protein (DUF58 family)